MLMYIYRKWLLNTKNVVALIGLAFINSIIVNKMYTVYEQSGQPFCIWESGIMTLNSGLIVVVLSVIFVMLMSNYPDTASDFYYCEIRTGRKCWYWCQMLFSVLGIITYMAVVLGFSAVRTEKISFAANGWSLNISNYGQKYALTSYIPLQLFNQMPPIKAYILSCILLFSYLFFIMSVQMFGFVLGKKKQALIINIIFLVAGVCASFFKSKIMFIFPFCHSVLWLHYDKYFKKSDWGTYCSIAILLLTGILIFGLSYRLFLRADIDKMKEEGT